MSQKNFEGYVRQIEYLATTNTSHAILDDAAGNQTFNIQSDNPRIQSLIELGMIRKTGIRGVQDDKTGLITRIEVNLANPVTESPDQNIITEEKTETNENPEIGTGRCLVPNCTCPSFRGDLGNPEKCVNIRPPSMKLCEHTKAQHR